MVAVTCTTIGCAACWDFVEPDFPEAGAPAVLQAAAIIDEAGHLTFDALLVPGLAIGGVQRRVARDTLDVYDLGLAPTAVRRNGTREYTHAVDVKAANVLTVPFELLGPVVEDVSGPPPRVRWYAFRKADPDTIRWQRGSELVLQVRAVAGTPSPQPTIRQWFMELRTGSRSFRLSADSLPPNQLRIPAAWVPDAPGDTMHVFFSFNQAGKQESPSKDYIGNISFTALLHWFVIVI